MGQAMRWRDLYPRVDVVTELNKAVAWLEANPTRQKTIRGMPKFCVGWLNRSDAQRSIIAFAAKLPSYRPRATRQAVCPHQPPCASPGNWQCQQRTVLEQARRQKGIAI